LHAAQLPGQSLLGFGRIAVIADQDRTVRVTGNIRSDPAQAPPEQLVPVTRGNDDRNAGQRHKSSPIQNRIKVAIADFDSHERHAISIATMFLLHPALQVREQ
jgi:hypothetical protein